MATDAILCTSLNSSITFANHCGDFQLTYHELLLCLFQLSEWTWYETCTEWGLLPQQNGLSKGSENYIVIRNIGYILERWTERPVQCHAQSLVPRALSLCAATTRTRHILKDITRTTAAGYAWIWKAPHVYWEFTKLLHKQELCKTRTLRLYHIMLRINGVL